MANKTQVIDALSRRLGGDRRAAAAAVDGFIDFVIREVDKGERVTITGFGSFEPRERAARTARNPRTGETVRVKKATVPAFRAGTLFREVVGGTRKLPKAPAAARATAARTTSARPAAAPAAAPTRARRAAPSRPAAAPASPKPAPKPAVAPAKPAAEAKPKKDKKAAKAAKAPKAAAAKKDGGKKDGGKKDGGKKGKKSGGKKK